MAKKTGKQLAASDDLTNIIGKEKVTMSVAAKLCWAYAKEHNLTNGFFFTPDKKMAKVFGTDKVRVVTIKKFLSNHLTAPA